MSSIQLQLREQLTKLETREERRIELAEITSATGIPEQTLQSMLDEHTDQISLHALAHLCDYLHCRPADLLNYSTDAPESDNEVDARDIVDHWHRHYGSDEHPPE